MFDPKECEHVPKEQKQNEKDLLIKQLFEENELLKGCIMEICDVVFAEEITEKHRIGGSAMSKLVQLYVKEIRAGNITLEEDPAGLKSKVEAALAEENNSQENGCPKCGPPFSYTL